MDLSLSFFRIPGQRVQLRQVSCRVIKGAGAMSSGAAKVVQAVTPDDLSFPDLSDVASGISMDDLPPEIRQTLEQNGITVDHCAARRARPSATS
jgi:hypothetical protein